MRLIDADALLEDGIRIRQGLNEDGILYIPMRDVNQSIKKAPTVDAAPVVHGRWINWGKSGTPTYENYGTCSVCHEDAEIHTEHRNYCPNCGAKMDRSDDI